MSENVEKNIQVDPGFDLPNNRSILNSDNILSHELIRRPELQFIVSQLASFVMPVSPISIKEDGTFRSIDVSNHDNFSESADSERVTNEIFLDLIFRDYDHFFGHNERGGVYFDFDQAEIYKIEDFQVPRNLKDLISETGDLDTRKRKLALLRNKILYFQSMIEGEKGEIFLKSLVKKAKSNSEDLFYIRATLLTRCNKSLELIDNLV